MSSDGKIYFSYARIHNTVRDLSNRILSSGYDPDIIVAIGTGGFIPARMMKTYISRPIFTVGLSLYDKNNNPKPAPEKIQWIDEVEQKICGKRILLVDEVDDSRVTLEYCLRELLANKPAEIAVAVLHNKLKEKRGVIPAGIDRYYCGEELEDRWICYPWDAEDIDLHQKLAEGLT